MKIPNLKKITNWYLRIDDDEIKIYGQIIPYGKNYVLHRGGKVIGYKHNVVLCKIDCEIYALGLGNVSDQYKQFEKKFYHHLHKRPLEVHV